MAGVDEQRVVAAVRADPQRTLIALDFDGTLAPIVKRPEDARPVPEAVGVLRMLAARGAQVTLISGRGAQDVVRLAGVTDVPGLRVLGHYGLQLWRDGVLTTPDPDPGVGEARTRLPAVLSGAHEGVYVEDKVHSLVIHSRPASDPQGALDELRPALVALAAETGLEAVPGRYVLELRPPGVDKGVALAAQIAEIHPRVVIYAGDDLGDLPAVDVVKHRRSTGELDGLTVAVVPPDSPDAPDRLRAEADLVLAGQVELVAWLNSLLTLD